MSRNRRIPAPLLVLALVYPTAAALFYFVYLSSHALAAPTYFVCKAIQFFLPVLVLGALLRSRPARGWRVARSLAWGLGSGLLLTLPLVLIYFGVLRETPVAGAVSEAIAVKMTDFGIADAPSYWAMSLFLSLLHSALEEIYWRWFVFGGLREYLGIAPSVIVSSLGFMSHHVVVLVTFLVPGPAAGLVVPAAFGVAFAGVVWALLALRSGRLFGPWISHVIADLAIMGLGWELMWS